MHKHKRRKKSTDSTADFLKGKFNLKRRSVPLIVRKTIPQSFAGAIQQ